MLTNTFYVGSMCTKKKDGKAHLNFYKAETLLPQKDKVLQENWKDLTT